MSGNDDSDTGSNANVGQQQDETEPVPDTPHSDMLIADALKSMTLEDREKVIFEVHGVDKRAEEEPNFLENCLRDQKIEIEKLKDDPSLPTDAIKFAETIDPDYVYDNKLLLKFLRAERYDPNKAAGRMIRYFDWKVVLFGKSKVCKDIAYKDLPPDSIKLLKKGYLQVLPTRDSSGRAVWFSMVRKDIYKDTSPESWARCFFYMYKTDEETDKEGVVSVCFKIGDIDLMEDIGLDKFSVHARSLTDLPYRFQVFHKCLASPSCDMGRLLDLLVTNANVGFRVRYKIHFGSYTDWIYSLMSFGIPNHLMPIGEDGKIKVKNHLEFLKLRRAGEELPINNRSLYTTELPLNTDVLLGKGKPIQEHMGNMRLQAMVEELIEEYHNSSKPAKTALTIKVVNTLKASSSHFLSKETGIWTEVSDEIAREKVSHLFRARKNLLKNRANYTTKGTKDFQKVRIDPNVDATAMKRIRARNTEE